MSIQAQNKILTGIARRSPVMFFRMCRHPMSLNDWPGHKWGRLRQFGSLCHRHLPLASLHGAVNGYFSLRAEDSSTRGVSKADHSCWQNIDIAISDVTISRFWICILFRVCLLPFAFCCNQKHSVRNIRFFYILSFHQRCLMRISQNRFIRYVSIQVPG